MTDGQKKEIAKVLSLGFAAVPITLGCMYSDWANYTRQLTELIVGTPVSPYPMIAIYGCFALLEVGLVVSTVRTILKHPGDSQ